MQSKNKKVGVTPLVVGAWSLSKFLETYGKTMGTDDCKDVHAKCVSIYNKANTKSKDKSKDKPKDKPKDKSKDKSKDENND